jgi:hypothetical protein
MLLLLLLPAQDLIHLILKKLCMREEARVHETAGIATTTRVAGMTEMRRQRLRMMTAHDQRW